MRWAQAWVVPAPPRSAWQRWGRSLVLFLVTVCSVFLVGAGGVRIAVVPGVGHVVAVNWRDGLLLAGGLMSILLSHEMGHYLACRYYHVDATLPHFIPAPWIPVAGLWGWMPLSFVGTFGAFIRIRSPIPSRRALFDIGIAGPLAGFAVCLPVLWLGIHEARVVPPSPDGIPLGDPLLFQALERLVKGPLPDTMTLSLGSLGLAAWFGLFVTALNLMPIGQLDGGHVTYALFGEKSRHISRVGSWACLVLLVLSPSWILWTILVRVLGRRHPPTLDDQAPLGRGRVVLGVVALVVFVVCFLPNPLVVSWRDFYEGVRELLR